MLVVLTMKTILGRWLELRNVLQTMLVTIFMYEVRGPVLKSILTHCYPHDGVSYKYLLRILFL